MNRERGFDAAEGKRLLYVAATRARARVVVMNPTGGRVHARRLWEELADRTPLLPHPGEPPAEPPRGPSGAVLPESAPAAAVAAIEQRWRSAAASGHAVETVKHMALRRGRREPGGEHGTEWGSVVHVLLEAAMRHGAAGLERVARSALQEQGLDPRRRDEAISLVRSVMASPLWRRATTCTKRLVEVPIQYLLQENVAEPRRPPTIVRGVIDLAFREPQGWVIVDYKTDDRPGRPLEALIAHYAPQVRSYARAWNRAVGQAPHEIGLFFVNSGRYRTVDPADRPP
jgi:ATP-dependent helicase/nuclease subunit A